MSDFRTRAELTDFQETSRYPEAIEYCKRLEEASDYIRYVPFGISPEGRELPLLIASRDRIFTAEEAHKSGRLILLILNGIHPGEIAGKEASFALLRDIAVDRRKIDLLDRVVILLIPIYNVDGHERFGPYNRINQNGPKEMGWRTNSQNRNLNRDWMKAEEIETRALLQIYNRWMPHFVIDNHVSDGADFQYDVTYLLDDNIRVARPIYAYLKERFEPGITSGMTDLGHITAPYFELRNQSNPADGINIGPTTARFSNGYGALRNRPNITVETHMLKSFQNRIIAHYDLMEVILRMFNAEGEMLQSAVQQADRETAALEGSYPIRLSLDEKKSEHFLFKGVEYTREPSEVSGATRIIYGKKPLEMTVAFFKTLQPDRTISVPLGYLIPAQFQFVLNCLQAHNVVIQRLRREMNGEFQTYRFENVSWEQEPFEGHHMAHFTTKETMMHRTFPASSAIVWLNQPENKLILELLEPDSADSLVSWGFFDAIFEDKEYAEAFILEDLAHDLIARDERIADEFQARLNEDAEFRKNPAARLRFFYDYSSYRDERKCVYPIARITDKAQIPSDAL